LDALDLERDDVVPFYVGGRHHRRARLRGAVPEGIGVFVGRADDPEVGGRTTAPTSC
jgi:trehalose 6-phosphate phosphatase